MEQTKDVEWVADASGWMIDGTRYGKLDGPVITSDGIVIVSQSGGWTGASYGVTLDYAVNGRHFRRVIKRREPYSRRYLVTLAKRFAEEKFSEFLEGICV